MHIAAQAGQLASVKLLIAKGADLNATTGRDVTAPPAAGAPPKRGGGAGQTPLMLAARGGHPDVMRALIEAGANTKLKAADGSTLLLSASASARIETVKYAYTLDQDVKAVTTEGQTVLHLAVLGFSAGAAQVVQFLADKGAALDLPDSAGDTPLDIAIADGARADSVMLLTKLIKSAGMEPRKH